MGRPFKPNAVRIEGNVVWLKLTQGKETCIDLADWPAVAPYRWSLETVERNVYARARLGSRAVTQVRVFLHRFLLPGCRQVDHKDMDGLNNQRANLRSASCRENAGNARKHRDATTSRFRGVCYVPSRKRFQAGICVGRVCGRRVQKSLGRFKIEEDAARAYDQAAKQHFGEFARLNFPQECAN